MVRNSVVCVCVCFNASHVVDFTLGQSCGTYYYNTTDVGAYVMRAFLISVVDDGRCPMPETCVRILRTLPS